MAAACENVKRLYAQALVGVWRVSGTRAEAARSVLGERVAGLAVGGPHECGDDVEVPFLDVGCLAPEVGEAEVYVELEEVDPGRSLGMEESVGPASDGVGSRDGKLRFGPARVPSRKSRQRRSRS